MTRPTLKEALLAVSSGVLTAFAMPGFGAAPLIFVSLVPLFCALQRRGGLWPGFLFGVAFFAIDLRWIVTLTRFHPMVIGGYLLLIVYFAAGCAILGAVLSWRAASRASTWLLLAPALFVILEYMRTLGPLGMGFSTLYQSLYRVPQLIQAASIFGSFFLTGILVAVNGSIFALLLRRKLRFALLACALGAALSMFVWVPGAEQGETMRVAVVSSDVVQEVKLNSANLRDLADRYLRLGDVALEATPDLVVFPESILPAYLLQNESLRASFAGLASRGRTQVLVGTGVYENHAIYNAVALMSESGDLVGTFRMVRPVPFGEYIPGRSLLNWIGLGAWADSFLPVDLSRGDGYLPLTVYGTPICFESTFPDPSRQLCSHGAQILVTPTNDAWFDGSSELVAHFACAVFRAVENRRWVVQSANGGISGFVSPSGRITQSLRGEGVVAGDVELHTQTSLYTRWGDWLLLGFALAAAGGSLASRFLRGRQSGARSAVSPPDACSEV